MTEEMQHRITEPMLAKALSNELGVSPSDITIKSLQVASGSNKGDNFACTMVGVSFVAEVKGRGQADYHYLAKCVPMNEIRAKFLENAGFFSVEVQVYESILPRLKNLESCPCTKILFPEHFYASVEEGVILFKDLRLDGHFMADKAVGLNTIQIRLVLQQLARLHATSYHLLQTFPGGFEGFKKEFPVLCRETLVCPGGEAVDEMFEGMFSTIFNAFVVIVEEFAGKDGSPGLGDRLRAFNVTRKKRIDAVHKPAPEDGNGFNVMLHNDAWCNNFLFKNNVDGATTEAVMLDLQLTKRGRPAVDLAYFFGSSTTPEFRKKNLEEMLRLYHNELSRVLLIHGYDAEFAYPFEAFRKEYDECFVHGFAIATLHTGMALSPPDAINVDADIKTEEDQLKVLDDFRKMQITLAQNNPVLRNRLIDLAKEAEALGYLDN